jgi:putative transcriptional regulator
MGRKKAYEQPIEPGVILISEPFLPDPNFERSVVLICEHSEQGTLGFMLNKMAEITLGDVVEEMAEFNAKIYVGGPVEQNTMHFLHRSGHRLDGSFALPEGISWGGDFDSLKFLVNTKQIDCEHVKFFLGYSGWAPKQLQREIKEKSWIVYKPESLMPIWDMDSEDLWRSILKQMGGKFKMLSNYPIDPRLN